MPLKKGPRHSGQFAELLSAAVTVNHNEKRTATKPMTERFCKLTNHLSRRDKFFLAGWKLFL
jgi:hypothetical protein